ncbi:MAG: PLP-dependent aspartate aminotransferase family protein [Acidobacteriota bacterium]|nr:PLP-dependent aspartate aminotransferase family protein [Acidobacteriota bacterium]
MKFDTKCVRAAIAPDPTTGAIVPPLYQTATYVLPEVGQDRGFDYTRSSNPTRQMAEEQLASLEGMIHGRAFASGMSAVDAVFRLFGAGDHIVCGDDVYGGVTRLLDRVLDRAGIAVTYVDASQPGEIAAAMRDETRLVWIETPTNPLLKVADVEAAAKIAHDGQALLGVDSTFATPYHLQPAELGADIVMHSTTKYLSGHNLIIGGMVLVNDDEVADGLRFLQKSIGAVPSPFDCWLLMHGLKTLSLRMARHSSNAAQVATFLAEHPKVARVAYPGLENDPGHPIAARQMRNGFSGMVSFELVGGTPAGIELMNAVQLCALAESLGAVESMITHPSSMTHADVPKEEREARGLTDGLVRISVGIEDPEDILADLDHGLEEVSA